MKKSQFIIFYILFFTFYAYVNLLHPVLPNFIVDLNLNKAYLGVFYSLMSLGQVIGAVIFGVLSDKIGRKWLIVIGTIGYALSQLGFCYFTENPYVTSTIFRILAGISSAAPITLFVSMLLDYSPNESKSKNLMILSSCMILGTSVGYEIGGSLYDFAFGKQIEYVFITQAALGGLIALVFALTMPSTKPQVLEAQVNGEAPKKDLSKSKFSIKSLLNLNIFVYICLFALFVLTIGQVIINKWFDPYILDIGFDNSILGHYILITGVISALVNVTIIPLIKRVKNKKLAVLLTIFIGLSAGLTFITFLVKTNFMYLLFSSHLIYLVLKTLITPLEQNELASYSSISNNGQVMGARQTILSLGSMIGPLIGSAIIGSNEKVTPLVFIIAASIIIGSLLIYIIYFILKYKSPKYKDLEKN